VLESLHPGAQHRARLGGLSAAQLEEATKRRRQIVRLDVAVTERGHQHVDALDGPEVPIEKDDVLAVHPASAATHAVAHLAQQHLLAHLYAESFGQLPQLLEERIVTPTHGGRF
jgi:hypothetical protein